MNPSWLLALLLLTWSRPAFACDTPCAGPTVFPPRGETPANWFMLSYKPGPDPNAMLPKLFSGKTELPLQAVPQGDGSFKLSSNALHAGDFVMLELQEQDCRGPGDALAYTISQPRPRPTVLGQLLVEKFSGPRQVPADNEACEAEVTASSALITVKFSDLARPLFAVIRFQLVVDGKEHHGAPFSGSELNTDSDMGQKSVYAPCISPPGFTASDALTPGTHRLLERGILPDGTTLETPEVVVDLSCEGVKADERVFRDGGVTDAAPSGCNLAGGTHTPAAFALVLAVFRRRRRTPETLRYKRA